MPPCGEAPFTGFSVEHMLSTAHVSPDLRLIHQGVELCACLDGMRTALIDGETGARMSFRELNRSPRSPGAQWPVRIGRMLVRQPGELAGGESAHARAGEAVRVVCRHIHPRAEVGDHRHARDHEDGESVRAARLDSGASAPMRLHPVTMCRASRLQTERSRFIIEDSKIKIVIADNEGVSE